MRKLSVKEKHIYVTQGLQRQGSYRKDKQSPQAIDIALNIAQSRLIKARLFVQDNQQERVAKARFGNKAGANSFEIDQKHVSDIQMLIKTDFELPCFKESTAKSYGVLPYDFSYLLSSTSFVIESCQTGFATATESKSERVMVFNITSAKVAKPYFLSLAASVNGNTDTITTSGFQTQDERTYIVDSLLASLKNFGVRAYWETYKEIYKPNCILVATLDLTTNVGISIDGNSIVKTNIDNQVTVFKTVPAGTEALNRDTKMDFLDSARMSNYHKSLPVSPPSIINSNKLTVYGSERFLANRILVSYIRKPKSINLSLNQGSELSPVLHEEICDLGIQILKKQIEDESIQIDMADNRDRLE